MRRAATVAVRDPVYCRKGHPMRRKVTAVAALVAASLFLAPSPARAQFFYSSPGGFFASPAYIAPSYRTSYLYYHYGLPYNPVVNNPFGYGTGMTPGLFAPAPLASVAPSARPVIGLTAYNSAISPFGYGGFGSYAGYPSYLYPNFGYPMGYGAPGFLNTTNVLDPFSNALPGVPMLTDPGLSLSGLSTVPYTPGLYLNPIMPVTRVATAVEVENPKTAKGNVLFSSAPRSAPGEGIRLAGGPEKVAKEPARIEVRLPVADARVSFDDQKTMRTGMVREFETPSLTPGATYTYQVRASWMSGGKEISRTQKVSVRAGERAVVDFTAK
jgi:uncharacterized protein (TIGR03000 family)